MELAGCTKRVQEHGLLILRLTASKQAGGEVQLEAERWNSKPVGYVVRQGDDKISFYIHSTAFLH